MEGVGMLRMHVESCTSSDEVDQRAAAIMLP